MRLVVGRLIRDAEQARAAGTHLADPSAPVGTGDPPPTSAST